MTLYQDYRSIPVEVLRDFARVQAETTSIRSAADEAGIGRTTFHKFVLGRTSPHPRVRRLLGLWYLRKHAEAPDIDVVRPYLSALSVLLSGLPDQQAAQMDVAATLATLYRPHGPLPRWLELLLNPSAPRTFTVDTHSHQTGGE